MKGLHWYFVNFSIMYCVHQEWSDVKTWGLKFSSSVLINAKIHGVFFLPKTTEHSLQSRQTTYDVPSELRRFLPFHRASRRCWGNVGYLRRPPTNWRNMARSFVLKVFEMKAFCFRGAKSAASCWKI